jgi:regulator of replication initiation timing
MPKYIAKQSIGHFMPGDEIKGLEDKQLQALLASGAIEEEKAPEQLKADGTAAQLASLTAEVAELKANEAILIEGKDKADAEVAELQKKVAELEKALATSEAALKKATAEAKKAPPADK